MVTKPLILRGHAFQKPFAVPGPGVAIAPVSWSTFGPANLPPWVPYSATLHPSPEQGPFRKRTILVQRQNSIYPPQQHLATILESA